MNRFVQRMRSLVRTARARLTVDSRTDHRVTNGSSAMSTVDSSNFKMQGAVHVLEWLADSPLFIDSSLVGAFYDAVVRPESTVGMTTISTSNTRATEKEAGAKLGVAVGLPQILTS